VGQGSVPPEIKDKGGFSFKMLTMRKKGACKIGGGRKFKETLVGQLNSNIAGGPNLCEKPNAHAGEKGVGKKAENAGRPIHAQQKKFQPKLFTG